MARFRWDAQRNKAVKIRRKQDRPVRQTPPKELNREKDEKKDEKEGLLDDDEE